MKQSISYLLSINIIFCLFSCEDDKNYNFKDQELQGLFNNKEWSYEGGKAKKDSMIYQMEIHGTVPDSINICDTMIISKQLLVTVPREKGVFELSPSRSVTFSYKSGDNYDNIAATKGAVEILSISKNSIKGRIDAKADSDHKINGNFTIPICTP
ncbi:MAG: hypothetical protein ABEH43_02635 [Flavobacteriales bacterium]